MNLCKLAHSLALKKNNNKLSLILNEFSMNLGSAILIMFLHSIQYIAKAVEKLNEIKSFTTKSRYIHLGQDNFQRDPKDQHNDQSISPKLDCYALILVSFSVTKTLEKVVSVL